MNIKHLFSALGFCGNWSGYSCELLLWTQVFSIAYFCNIFHPNASIHGHGEEHQEEHLQDWQHCVFGQYTWIDIIPALQNTCIFLYHNTQAVLHPVEGVLPLVSQTSFSPPCTYIFHKFSINFQYLDGNAASLEFFSHVPSYVFFPYSRTQNWTS